MFIERCHNLHISKNMAGENFSHLNFFYNKFFQLLYNERWWGGFAVFHPTLTSLLPVAAVTMIITPSLPPSPTQLCKGLSQTRDKFPFHLPFDITQLLFHYLVSSSLWHRRWRCKSYLYPHPHLFSPSFCSLANIARSERCTMRRAANHELTCLAPWLEHHVIDV